MLVLLSVIDKLSLQQALVIGNAFHVVHHTVSHLTSPVLKEIAYRVMLFHMNFLLLLYLPWRYSWNVLQLPRKTLICFLSVLLQHQGKSSAKTLAITSLDYKFG